MPLINRRAAHLARLTGFVVSRIIQFGLRFRF
jgi:hypothetical protein